MANDLKHEHVPHKFRALNIFLSFLNGLSGAVIEIKGNLYKYKGHVSMQPEFFDSESLVYGISLLLHGTTEEDVTEVSMENFYSLLTEPCNMHILLTGLYYLEEN